MPLGKKVRKGEDRNRKKSKSKSRKVSKSQRENQNSERSPPTLSTNTTPTFSGGSVDVTGLEIFQNATYFYKNWNTLFCKNEPHFCLPVGKLMQVQPNYFWLNRSNFLANTYIVFVLHCAPQLQWGDAKISAITYKT